MELEKSLEEDAITPSDVLISIGNPSNGTVRPDNTLPEIFQKRYRSILRLEFWDVERRDPALIKEGEIARFPEPEDIEKVLQLYDENRNASFDVHCWKGVARSAAMAYILLFQTIKNEYDAARELINIRRIAMPNKLIVEMYDQKYGTNLGDYKNTVFKARIARMREELRKSE